MYFCRREAARNEKLRVFSECIQFEDHWSHNRDFNCHFHCRFTLFPLVNLLSDRRFLRDGTGSFMKAKSSYSGLESFFLSFSTKKTELLQLPGSNASMSRINDLFDAGREEEARMALRQALEEITRDLAVDQAGGKGSRSLIDRKEPDTVASLLLNLEF
jgi:hypothetical protein